MTPGAVELPVYGSLDGEERERFLRLLGLAARPSLGAEQSEALRKLLAEESWKPVPRLPVVRSIEPLILHHVIAAGGNSARVFAPPSSPPNFEQIAIAYYRRREVLLETFGHLADRGVRNLLLVKGAAFAPLYPSPALREMEDVDLVAKASDVEQICVQLPGCGWAARRSGGWMHSSGCILDLQLARPSLELLERSIAHPLYGKFGVRMPAPADHLNILAVHAARHRGLRIWRDLCDARLLIGDDSPATVLDESIRRARKQQSVVPLVALLRRLRERTECAPSLSEAIVRAEECAGLSKKEEAEVAKLTAFYEKTMIDRISELGFTALDTTLVSPLSVARALGRSIGGVFGAQGSTTVQKDDDIGELAAAGTFRRQWLKLRITGSVLFSRRVGHYCAMLGASRRARRGDAPFTPVGNR